MGQADADFHEMRAGEFWRFKVIDFQRLDSRAASLLAVVEISRVHIRSEIHRLLAGTREHVGVELLHAEVRFKYGLIADRACARSRPRRNRAACNSA